MKRIRIIGLALVAVVAISAVAAASASAHEFKASENPGTLAGKQVSNQVFETPGGTVTCKADIVSGAITALTTKKQVVKVKYSECTLFGFIGATVSEAEYEFEAEPSKTEGKVKILKEIKVKVKNCEVKVPAPQGPLGPIEYLNSGTKMEVKAKVTAIKSSGIGPTGEGCKDYVDETAPKGKYTGNNLVEEIGGTIEYV